MHTTPAVLAELTRGQQADLGSVLLVREDALTLYGFTDPAAHELFVALQTVAGIGSRWPPWRCSPPPSCAAPWPVGTPRC